MDVVKLLQGDRWLKHPAHPVFVALPIGLWLFSSVMDGVASVTKNRCAQEAADDAIIGGLIGAGLAASTGVAEFLRVPTGGHAASEAVTHGALNATAATLYGINAAMRNSARKRGSATGLAPRILSLLGVGIIGYTGWLGGNLVYNHGTGVSLNQAVEDHQSSEMQEQEKEEREIRAHI